MIDKEVIGILTIAAMLIVCLLSVGHIYFRIIRKHQVAMLRDNFEQR